MINAFKPWIGSISKRNSQEISMINVTLELSCVLLLTPTRSHVSAFDSTQGLALGAHLFLHGAPQRRQFSLHLMLAQVGVSGRHRLPLGVSESRGTIDLSPRAIASTARSDGPRQFTNTHQPSQGGKPHLTNTTAVRSGHQRHYNPNKCLC